MKKTLLAGMAAITLVTAQGSFVPQTVIASSQDAAFDLKGIKDDITSIKDDDVEKAKDLFNKLKDVKDHWAAAAIQKAIERGYVNGYGDLTFKPNAQVTRAEFIKMVVVGIGINTSSVAQGSKWYDPYVNAAIQNNLITAKEYPSGDYNTAMTRMEMARLSVRAIGKTASSDAEYMYLATKNGLISGVGNGKLAENDTTTRAQAVTIIERIITVREGGSLPVDQAAVKTAEAAMNAKTDPWGSAIRTTNLPSNAKNFPYILEKWPNEMYELKLKYSREFISAAKFVEDDLYSKEAAKYWADTVNQWGKQILNVDYKTIGDDWAEKYMGAMLQQGSGLKTSTDKYVKWVKENQIAIEGSLTAEPSIVQYADGAIYVRSYFRFKINSYKADKDIVQDFWYSPGTYKKNQWYEGYADIPLVTKVYMGTYKDYKVASSASIFMQGSVKEAK
ncbi:hypothetical protein PACILC2_36730 [Paenibacillus cisolokensis]|jgi:S-layer homology domain.|uniref:SLH domain-containing protein n=1 Tax=Paenibacillus cisolokensis TaxID=1658519 RepID=A0ABQ4NAA7_9BACL|nr:S-layer homology domain-containing protein [Paenibacillus cisolokensis]GIQ65105.1 hypothetical protein PACILC2_36730 [Paenibacillus cisolokensis]